MNKLSLGSVTGRWGPRRERKFSPANSDVVSGKGGQDQSPERELFSLSEFMFFYRVLVSALVRGIQRIPKKADKAPLLFKRKFKKKNFLL